MRFAKRFEQVQANRFGYFIEKQNAKTSTQRDGCLPRTTSKLHAKGKTCEYGWGPLLNRSA
jgi:hypothetical protein